MHRFYRCTIWFLSLLFQQHLSDFYVSVTSSQGAQLRSRGDVAASAFRFQQFCSNQFVHQDPNIESTDPVEDWEKGWSPMSFQVVVYGCVRFWTSQVIQFGPNFVACSDTSPVLEQCYRYDRYARRTLQLGFFEAWLNSNLGIPHSKSWELS